MAAANLRRRGTWEVLLDLGPQPARRCYADHAGKHRWWTDGRPLTACPVCGGPLVDVRERRQLFKSGFATKAEAQQVLNRLRADRDAGAVVRPSKLTVAEWYRRWLPGLNDLRDTTRASYERLARLHVLPYIGATPLQEVDTARLNELYAALTSQGLSPATVQRVHAVVSAAFTAATDDGKLSRNPARRRGRGKGGPRVPKPQTADVVDPQAWTAEQARDFLAAMRVYQRRRVGGEPVREPDRLYALWRLLVSTGMRRGEALALTWDRIDLEAGRVTVNISNVPTPVGYGVTEHLPKSGRSRTLELDAVTVAALHEHRKRQTVERLRAARWHEGSGGGYVFAYKDGRCMHPERATRSFAVRVASLPELPRLTVHGLRHTWATLALQAGVPVHVVSAQLGHRSPDITLRVYAHVLAGQTRDATERVTAIIDGDGGSGG